MTGFTPRNVPCPTCGAKIGSPCVRPSGHRFFGGDFALSVGVASYHRPRYRAAMQLEDALGKGSVER